LCIFVGILGQKPPGKTPKIWQEKILEHFAIEVSRSAINSENFTCADYFAWPGEQPVCAHGTRDE